MALGLCPLNRVAIMSENLWRLCDVHHKNYIKVMFFPKFVLLSESGCLSPQKQAVCNEFAFSHQVYLALSAENDGGMEWCASMHPTCGYLVMYPGSDAAAHSIIVNAALKNVSCHAVIRGTDGAADGHVGRGGELAGAKQLAVACYVAIRLEFEAFALLAHEVEAGGKGSSGKVDLKLAFFEFGGRHCVAGFIKDIGFALLERKTHRALGGCLPINPAGA